MTTARADGSTAPTPTRVVVARVKALRRRRGLNTAALAERCAALGAPEVTDQVVRNIETGRRTVSVDHLCALAAALEVSPVHLLAAEDGTHVATTSELHVGADEWNSWVRGAGPLSQGMDARAFWGYALEHSTHEDAEAAVALARSQAGAAVARVMGQVQADSAAETAALRGQLRAALSAVADAASGQDPTALHEALARAQDLVQVDAKHR